MRNDSHLIKKTFYGIMIVNIISMISGVLCVMIDAIITGQFLGTNAVTASGLINPIVLICNLIGAILGPGVSIVCTRFTGMAKPEKVNQAFSLVMIAMVSISALVSTILFIFSPNISTLLASETNNEEIIQMTNDYLRGFAFGIIPMCFSHGLTGLMMLDNDKKRGILGIVVTLISDVILDLLNVLVFHGGMLGMAIATSLSSLIGAFVVFTHFFKKERILHFTIKNLCIKDLKDTFLSGFPNAIIMGCVAIRGMVFNYLLLSISTTVSVAAITVANSAFSIVSAITLGMFASTSTMCSLLYGEEDRSGIIQALKQSLRTVLIGFFILCSLLMIFARPFATLFLDSQSNEELIQSVRFIRFMAVKTFITSISIALSGAYQGIKRLLLNYSIDSLREGILPIVCALIMGQIFGLAGFEWSFIVSSILFLIYVFIVPIIINKRFSFKIQDLLLLPPSFGAKEEDTYSASIIDIDGVIKASNEVMSFCFGRNIEKRLSNLTSLFVEEMASNTIQHGFKNNKPGHIDLRIINKGDMLVIRLRDDGIAFDPVDWLKRNNPTDPSSGVGIRIIIGLATEVKYVPAMGLNNMIIMIKK